MKTCALICMTLLMVTAVFADVPPVPATPAAVKAVVYARPFTLAEGYPFEWRKEQPLVKEGFILVLKVNPDLVFPRQELEPVLYVGNQTAERVNVGYKSGHVIAIVPGKIELAKTPIWFGRPELPERVDARMIEKERALAEKAGIKPLDERKTKRKAEAKTAGKIKAKIKMKLVADTLEAANRDELRRSLAPLVKKYAPTETGLLLALELIPEPDSDQ